MWWQIVWVGEMVFWQQLRLKVAALPKFSCSWKKKICDESAPKLSIPSLQMLSSSIFAFTLSFEGAYLGWQLWSGKIHRAENAILMHHNNSIELFLFNIHLICLLSLFNSLIMDRARTPWIVKGNKSLSLVWSKWGSQYWNISLKADVSLSLIGREESSRFIS